MSGLYRRAEAAGIHFAGAFRLHGQCVGHGCTVGRQRAALDRSFVCGGTGADTGMMQNISMAQRKVEREAAAAAAAAAAEARALSAMSARSTMSALSAISLRVLGTHGRARISVCLRPPQSRRGLRPARALVLPRLRRPHLGDIGVL